MGIALLGREALEQTIGAFRSKIKQCTARVVIIWFPHVSGVESRRLLATEISTRTKAAAFRRAGLNVEVIAVNAELSDYEVSQHIDAIMASNDTVGVLIQRPKPPALVIDEGLLNRGKDIEFAGANDGKLCATAEATMRLIDTFPDIVGDVAVVGGKGFVGSYIVKGLQARGIKHIVVETGEPISSVRRCSTVISAVGQPSLIGANVLSPMHRLVIDIGFTPLSVNPVVVAGDVVADAVPSRCFYTPVPGGIGPLQISVLIERCAYILGVNIPRVSIRPPL